MPDLNLQDDPLLTNLFAQEVAFVAETAGTEGTQGPQDVPSAATKTGRGRSQTRGTSFKKAFSLSPTSKRYVGIQREIVHEQQFMKQAFENGDINGFRGAQSTLEDLYVDRSSLESAMKGRQTYRHCKEGDPRAFVDVAEFTTSFIPGVGGTVANLAANAVGAKMDYDQGLINRQEYLARLAMSGVGAGTSMKPTASHFTKPLGQRLKDRLSQTGERTQEAFEHFMQSGGGHAPKPAFAHANTSHALRSKFRSHSGPHGANTWFTEQGPSRTTATPATAETSRLQKMGEDVRTLEGKQLLPGEGIVAKFRELKKIDKPGDNLAAHHIPNDQYMRTHGVSRGDGVSIMVEHPTPGVGGRHREIHRELQRQDPTLAPRDALAQGIQRARYVYQKDGVYTPQVRQSLQEVIHQNKTLFPHLFEQGQ